MKHSDIKAKKIERLLKRMWSSLTSHSTYTYTKHPDGKDFHKRCVKEYAELIKLISELY